MVSNERRQGVWVLTGEKRESPLVPLLLPPLFTRLREPAGPDFCGFFFPVERLIVHIITNVHIFCSDNLLLQLWR